MDTMRRVPSRYLVLTSDLVVPGIIITSVLAAAYLFLASPVFKLQAFKCELDYQPCQEGAITAEIDRLKGQNIFMFETHDLERRLTSSEFTVATVETRKILPSTLEVTLISVRPHFAVKQEGDERYVVLDEKRRVIGLRSEDPHVPVLFTKDLPPLQIGQPISGTIDQAIAAAEAVVAAFIPYTAHAYDNGLLRVTLEDGPVASIDPAGNVERQVGLLQAVLRDRTILEGIATIDVRYAQPILK